MRKLALGSSAKSKGERTHAGLAMSTPSPEDVLVIGLTFFDLFVVLDAVDHLHLLKFFSFG